MHSDDKAIREALSALMDGELSQLELERLLRQLPDAECRSVWARYHVGASLLHKQHARPLASPGFADKVSQALAAEPAVGQPARTTAGRGVVRFAVAASVALAVVVGARWNLPGAGEDAGPVMAQAALPAPVVQGTAIGQEPPAGRTPVPAPQLASQPGGNRSQLDRYMQYHLEHAALGTQRGMVPLARTAMKEER